LGFAKEGVNLVIADLDVPQGEKVAALAKEMGAKDAIVVKTDVTKPEETEALAKAALDKFGSIDTLVNNVGFDKLFLFVETTPDFWDKIIDVNYKGVLNCTKAVLPTMIEQKGGAIVNIGSDAGRIGEYKEAVYGGIKGAVIAFSKAVARENGRYGIRLNVVCPGMTVPASEEEVGDGSAWKTQMSLFPPEYLEKAAKNYPLRRLGTAQEVANATVFLGSDAAGFITGQTLSVSGGYTMM
jgi:NAD(P)-dependent dehydrogenase (short-subunit alcohol dehydrogenase family)